MVNWLEFIYIISAKLKGGGIMLKVRTITITLFSLIILFSSTGCEKKTETVPEGGQDTTAAETTQADTQQQAQAERPQVIFPDMKGTWTGKLYNREAILNINEQDSTTFKGKLTVYFRENINQTISGEIDPKTLEVRMRDQVHNRAMGTYRGKLSNDSTTLSGTFTMNADKSTHNFNFNKK